MSALTFAPFTFLYMRLNRAMRICMPRWCRPKMAGCSSRKRAVKRRQRPRARKYPWLRSGAWKGSKEAMIRPKSWGCTVLEASYHRMENEIDQLHFSKQNIGLYEKIIYSQNSGQFAAQWQSKAKWPKTCKNMWFLFRIINGITDTLSTQRHKLQLSDLLSKIFFHPQLRMWRSWSGFRHVQLNTTSNTEGYQSRFNLAHSRRILPILRPPMRTFSSAPLFARPGSTTQTAFFLSWQPPPTTLTDATAAVTTFK